MLLSQGNCFTPGGAGFSQLARVKEEKGETSGGLTLVGVNTASCSSGLNSSFLINRTQTVFVVDRIPALLLQHSALAFPPDSSELSGGSGFLPWCGSKSYM